MIQHITLSVAPPSVNDIYARNRAGGVYRTQRYREWANAMGWEVKAQKFTPISGAFTAAISVPYDEKRDLDNYQKAIFDLLQACGVIANDKHCDAITINRVKGIDKVLVTLFAGAQEEAA